MKKRSPVVRLCISASAGIGAAVVAALVIAVIDLYVTGHGHGSISREVVTWDPAGVHLSIGDIAVLAAMIAVAASTWHLIGRGD